MRKILDLLPLIRILFDGEAGGETGGTAAPDAGEQPGEIQSDADSNQQTPETDPEERAKAWKALTQGEYKDLYDADVQKIVKSRLKETGELKQQLTAQQEIIDRLAAKYGTSDLKGLTDALDSDTALWEQAADEAGMTVDQYMQFQSLQRQNDQLLRMEHEREMRYQQDQMVQKWLHEAEELKAKYPDFDLETELQNPQFRELMSFKERNYPMEHVYKMCHVDDLIANASQTAAAQTEKAVTDNIRARGNRPVENGTKQGHGAFSTTNDYQHMSLSQLQDIAKQIKSGKKLGQ